MALRLEARPNDEGTVIFLMDGENTLSNVLIPHKKRTRSKAFCAPSVTEVKAYCKSRGNGIDAQKFVDHYEACGWMIGRNKMKSWQAAVRTWENRDKERKMPAVSSSAKKLHPEDEEFFRNAEQGSLPWS